MSFDVDKFRNAKIQPRTRDIKVDELKHFFSEEELPVFRVRNLTGHELAECHNAVTVNQAIQEMFRKITSSNMREKVEGACEALGKSEKTPDELVRKINMLRLGCVEPVLTNEDCVRLAAAVPIQFTLLTNNILELTGLGANLGE